MSKAKDVKPKKAAKKRSHGGKRETAGRKRYMIYPEEMGVLKPVAFQVPTGKIEEVKELVNERLASYRDSVNKEVI